MFTRLSAQLVAAGVLTALGGLACACGSDATPPSIEAIEAIEALEVLTPAPEAPAGAVVLDLVAALPAATAHRETVLIELGAPELGAVFVSGWGAREAVGDERYVWGLGEASVLELFVARPRPLTLVLDGLAFVYDGAPRQEVTPVWNGHVLPAVTVGAKRRRHRLAVPAAAQRSGANRLELRYAYHAAPAATVPGAEDARELAVRWHGIGLRGLRQASPPRAETASGTPLLELPAGSRVEYVVPASPEMALAVEEVLARPDGGGALVIEVEVDTGATGSGLRARLELDPAGGAERLTVPLPAAEEGLMRLALTAVPPRRGRLASAADRLLGDGDPALMLVHPRLQRMAPTPAPAVGGETARPAAAPARPPDVVLYVIDTLRADHLGVYGYGRDTSPEIDRFAAAATVFTQAEAQTSWTRTAMVSILTGLDPRRHGVNGREDALAAGIDTWAERLAPAGYRNVAVVTNGNLAPKFGLDQGFDDYLYLPESSARAEMHVLADGVNEEAFRRLDALAADPRPFFLYLHTSDPHAPYMPPEPFRSRFAAGVDPALGALDTVLPISRSQVTAPAGTAEAWIDLYDAEIAFNDHHFGRLLARLRALGRYDGALIVLVSDHGEEFFDHGGWEHGKTLYGEQLRVPLIVKLPAGRGSDGAGLRLDAIARQIDLLPTVLELAGLDSGGELDGVSLLALIAGGAPGAAPRASHAYLRLDERRMSSVAAAGWKAIYDDSEWVRSARAELFHVAFDPAERRDLHFDRPIPRTYLRQLERGLRLDQGRRRALPAAERADVDPELHERLKALGYVD